MSRVISEETNYWLVRTFSGKYYAEFSHRGYVALGWNEISDLDLIRSAAKKPKDQEKLTEMAKKLQKGDKNSQPGRITSPIMRFVNEIKIGDIIIIPSEDSAFLNFGKITSDPFLETKENVMADEGLISLYKRRNVEWVKEVERKRLDPYLFRLLNSHYAVTNANEYASYVDRTMYDFFTKGEKGHLVLEVKKESGIYGMELVELINQTLGIVDLVNDLTGENYDKNSVEVKLTLNSPGLIELAGGVGVIGAIATGTAILLGGKVNVSLFKGFSLETTGLKGAIQQYKEEKREDRKLDIEEKKLEIEKLKFIEALTRTNAQFPKEIAPPIEIAAAEGKFCDENVVKSSNQNKTGIKKRKKRRR